MAATVMQLISSLGVGGAERLLIDYVTAAAPEPRPQLVVVMNGGESLDFRRELKASGRPIYFLGRRPGALHGAVLLALLRLARAHDVGVVHSHNPGSMLWSCLMKAGRPSLKLAHSLHGQDAVRTLGGARGLLHRRLVDGTVAVSSTLEAAAAAAGLRRITRIDNGVALSRFAPVRVRRREGELRLVCIGRLTHDKGQDLLIQAVGLCRAAGVGVTARLVGDASREDPSYLARLKAEIDRDGLNGRVTLEHGRTDTPDILSEADVFVLPSRHEGFGLALVEAMASGLAVIAADTGGPREILRDAPQAGLLFAAGSARALADRIVQLARDEPLRRRLGQAAPLAAARYDIARMVPRYEAFYAGL